MDILGYVGYAGYVILIALAIIWTMGVRSELDAGVGVIFGAFFFLVSALCLGIFGVDKLHSLWIIPAGFAMTVALSYLAVYARPLFRPFQIFASLFANIVRVGIPAQQIREAQEAGMRSSVQEWASKRENTK